MEAVYNVWYMKWYEDGKNFIKLRLMELKSILKYGRIIEEDPMVSAIIKLRKNMSISSTKDSFIYILAVRDKFPKRAAMIVDAIGESLVDFLRNQYLGPAKGKLKLLELEVMAVKKQLDVLRSEREAILKESRSISVEDETTRGFENLYEMELEEIHISTAV